MEKSIYFGFNGEITKMKICSPKDNILDGFGDIPPLIEMMTDDNVVFECECSSSGDRFSDQELRDITRKVRKWVKAIYKKCGKFGPCGDIIQVSRHGPLIGFDKVSVIHSVDFMGNLIYPKPSLAADLVPFI